jgi:hypothetical protein
MAEVMEKDYASNAKGNAGLTLGIIGTALGGLLAMNKPGGLGSLLNLGGTTSCGCDGLPQGCLYNERKETQDYIELTKQYYEGMIETQGKIDRNFFELYKMNVDNSFGLYKNNVDTSFALYKGQRDTKDDLIEKINAVDKKVDMISAIRPYQDALINAKIDNVAMVADFNLARRTCRMIQGELVLPNTPTITGFASYSGCNCPPTSGTTV